VTTLDARHKDTLDADASGSADGGVEVVVRAPPAPIVENKDTTVDDKLDPSKSSGQNSSSSVNGSTNGNQTASASSSKKIKVPAPNSYVPSISKRTGEPFIQHELRVNFRSTGHSADADDGLTRSQGATDQLGQVVEAEGELADFAVA